MFLGWLQIMILPISASQVNKPKPPPAWEFCHPVTYGNVLLQNTFILFFLVHNYCVSYHPCILEWCVH
jgi:hypothetical protein